MSVFLSIEFVDLALAVILIVAIIWQGRYFEKYIKKSPNYWDNVKVPLFMAKTRQEKKLVKRSQSYKKYSLAMISVLCMIAVTAVLLFIIIKPWNESWQRILLSIVAIIWMFGSFRLSTLPCTEYWKCSCCGGKLPFTRGYRLSLCPLLVMKCPHCRMSIL